MQEAVPNNVEITVTIKTISCKIKGNQHQLPIFCQNFQIFCCKIEIFEKINDVLFLAVTNTTLVSRFMKSNKFYFVQTAKIVNVVSR